MSNANLRTQEHKRLNHSMYYLVSAAQACCAGPRMASSLVCSFKGKLRRMDGVFFSYVWVGIRSSLPSPHHEVVGRWLCNSLLSENTRTQHRLVTALQWSLLTGQLLMTNLATSRPSHPSSDSLEHCWLAAAEPVSSHSITRNLKILINAHLGARIRT